MSLIHLTVWERFEEICVEGDQNKLLDINGRWNQWNSGSISRIHRGRMKSAGAGEWRGRERKTQIGVESFSQSCLAITRGSHTSPAAFPISFQRGGVSRRTRHFHFSKLSSNVLKELPSNWLDEISRMLLELPPSPLFARIFVQYTVVNDK